MESGGYHIPTLEPLGDTMPFFNVPCLNEMLYLNVLAVSNLVSISLLAKVLSVITVLFLFAIVAEIGSTLGALVSVLLFLGQPMIQYFFMNLLTITSQLQHF